MNAERMKRALEELDELIAERGVSVFGALLRQKIAAALGNANPAGNGRCGSRALDTSYACEREAGHASPWHRVTLLTGELFDWTHPVRLKVASWDGAADG